MQLKIFIHNETPTGEIDIETQLGETYGEPMGAAMRETATVMEEAGRKHIRQKLLKVIKGGRAL